MKLSILLGLNLNTNKNPLVSIVIPTYNSQDWIVGLLESVVNQSYRNIEVILINDGSTDSSLDLVTQFAKSVTDVRVQVITQKNSGVSAARNEGVRYATGELLAFVDSDDIWFSRKIEYQVNKIVEEGISAVACSYGIFRDIDSRVIEVVHPDWSYGGVRNWLLLRSYGGLLSSTLMVSRDVFYKAGPFRTDLSLSADIEFAWRLLHVTPVKLIDEPLVGYRLRPNQMHKQSELLLNESQRMIKIIRLLQVNKFQRIFLSNLNLRLFLYCLQDKRPFSGTSFLFNALKINCWEVVSTLTRITSKRIMRKIKNSEKKSFFLSNP